VLPALLAVTTADADLVVMVKPQFEVGKQRLPSGGVVREADLRRDAVVGVIGAAVRIGLALRGVTASPLPGPSGNVEYFLWLHRDAQPPEDAGPAERAADVTADVVAQVDRAIREGPT
jgi:23S rRNA (cytidine1920-2'-O)/16S rRNA (cytidine1409-2'-O)-methyltransferase